MDTNRTRPVRRTRQRHAGLVLLVAVGLVAAVLAAASPAASAMDGRYELVLQDGEYRYLLDSQLNSRAWAGHCTDAELGVGTPRPVTWSDISGVNQEDPTPSCDELARRVASNGTTTPPVVTPEPPVVTPEPPVVTPEPTAPAECPATPFDQGRCEYRIANRDQLQITGGQPIANPTIFDERFWPESERNNGGFRTRCLVSHFSYSDPLVHRNFTTGNPNAAHPAHLHMFFGNTSTSPWSTNQTDETGNPNHLSNFDSTCGDLGADNKSAYWVPALFNVDGDVVVPDQINVYYKVTNPGEDAGDLYTADELVNMRPVPNDLQLVAGDGKISIQNHSNATWLTLRIEFPNCIRVDDNGLPVSKALPTSGHNRQNYEMTSHYNGIFSDNTWGDANGDTYVRIPGVEFNIQWQIADGDANRLDVGGWAFSNGTGFADVQGENANAQPDAAFSEVTLRGLHGDYMAWWEGNDSTFTDWPTNVGDEDNTDPDAMSLLTRSVRDSASSFTFANSDGSVNELDNLELIRDLNNASLADTGGKHDPAGGARLTDQLTVPALRNAPREIDNRN